MTPYNSGTPECSSNAHVDNWPYNYFVNKGMKIQNSTNENVSINSDGENIIKNSLFLWLGTTKKTKQQVERLKNKKPTRFDGYHLLLLNM